MSPLDAEKLADLRKRMTFVGMSEGFLLLYVSPGRYQLSGWLGVCLCAGDADTIRLFIKAFGIGYQAGRRDMKQEVMEFLQ